MKKYRVEISVTRYVEVEVEADSEDEASYKGMLMSDDERGELVHQSCAAFEVTS